MANTLKEISKEELNKVLKAHEDWYYKELDTGCADLSNTNLWGEDLRCVQLGSADLSNANLSCADLRCADLSNANLSNANLRNADLRCANLCGADLEGADLEGARLSEAILIHAKLKNVKNIDRAKRSMSCVNIEHINTHGDFSVTLVEANGNTWILKKEGRPQQ